MDSVVEDIKSRLMVDEIVGDYIELKKAGNNFKAVCPFHSERTPSFIVSPDKGIWHCFGCGEGGDIFGFVMRMEGMEFPEALRMLAKKAGVELKSYNPQEQGRKGKLLEINEEVAGFYRKNFWDTEEGKIAREYVKSREMNDATLDSFGIGYAPDSWEATFNYLKEKGFKEEDIEKAGLIIKRDNGSGYYDRFRKRLMFPLRDMHGQTLGFTARLLDENVEAAKYVNSPETDIYHKGKFLYALDLAKVSIKKSGFVILVEGQMDCISSHQAGVSNVIATSGTALTTDQLKILSRYTKNLILAFDMDAAGQEAMKRGIDLALAEGFSIRVVDELGGKDPDDIIKEDPDKWKKAIKDSVAIMEFYFNTAIRDLDLSQVENKKKVTKALLPEIAKLSDVVEQEHYLQKLASEVRVDVDVLRNAIQGQRPQRSSSSDPERNTQTTPMKPQRMTREERLFALVVKEPKKIDSLLDSIQSEVLSTDTTQDLYKYMENYYNNSRKFDAKEFIGTLKSDEPELAHHLDLWLLELDAEEADSNQENPGDTGKEIDFTLNKVKENYLREKLRRVSISLKTAEEKKNESEVDELTRELQKILDELQKVTRNL